MSRNVFVAFAYLKTSVAIIIVKGKGKCEVHHITGREGPKGE
jgi:hypothetical protein